MFYDDEHIGSFEFGSDFGEIASSSENTDAEAKDLTDIVKEFKLK